MTNIELLQVRGWQGNTWFSRALEPHKPLIFSRETVQLKATALLGAMRTLFTRCGHSWAQVSRVMWHATLASFAPSAAHLSITGSHPPLHHLNQAPRMLSEALLGQAFLQTLHLRMLYPTL